ncbi:hypothetical protein GQ600_24519 [Phytophthora cactorum]|nr:hypothetical protein GQ600_24519 [Phytophthora cactorum]
MAPPSLRAKLADGAFLPQGASDELSAARGTGCGTSPTSSDSPARGRVRRQHLQIDHPASGLTIHFDAKEALYTWMLDHQRVA